MYVSTVRLSIRALFIRILDCKTVQGDAPHDTPKTELCVLREKLQSTMEDIRSKRSNLTVQELRRLLYRCAAVLISLDNVSHPHEFLKKLLKKISVTTTYCITWLLCHSRLPLHRPWSSPSRFGAG